MNFFLSISLLFDLFLFNDTATTEIYTLSLHDALPISVADQVADVGTPPEQIPVARKAQPPDTAARQVPAAGLRRPPAAPARRALSAGLRRPPAAAARPPLPGGVARPPVKLTDRASALGRPAKKAPRKDRENDHEVVAAITTGDPAGIAMAYDRYAPALYGYAHWILH